MISIRVHWNPNDTPDHSSLLSVRLKNARPVILASTCNNIVNAADESDVHTYMYTHAYIHTHVFTNTHMY